MINKLIVRAVSFLLHTVQGESSTILLSNEEIFSPTPNLKLSVDMLIEFGELFNKINNKFLFIDSLLINIVDILYMSVIKRNSCRISFKLRFEKTLDLLIFFSTKNLPTYYRSKFDFLIFETRNELSGKILTVLSKLSNNFVTCIECFLCEKDKCLVIVKLKHNFNRVAPIDSLLQFVNTRIQGTIGFAKELRDKIFLRKDLALCASSVVFLLSDLKETFFMINGFKDQAVVIEDLMKLHIHVLHLSQSLIKLYIRIKELKKEVPKSETFVFLTRWLKKSISENIILYIKVTNKFKYLNQLYIGKLLDVEEFSADKITRTSYEVFSSKVSIVLQNSERLTDFIKRNNIVANLALLFIKSHIKSFHLSAFDSKNDQLSNTLLKNVNSWVNSIVLMIHSIESDYGIKLSCFKLKEFIELNSLRPNEIASKLSQFYQP